MWGDGVDSFTVIVGWFWLSCKHAEGVSRWTQLSNCTRRSVETERVVFFSKTNGQIGGKSDCDELPETPFNGSRRLRGGGSSYARERPSVNGRRRG
ncbi:MAG: hypothetical protein ACTS6G_02925, partial [Candidatus Hodgkinia cicadicola]